MTVPTFCSRRDFAFIACNAASLHTVPRMTIDKKNVAACKALPMCECMRTFKCVANSSDNYSSSATVLWMDTPKAPRRELRAFINAELLEKLTGEAAEERRTMTAQLELVLEERYSE